VAFIGFGEVGSSIARGLRGEGVEGIVAHDKFAQGQFGDLIRRRAAEAAVRLVDSCAEAVSGAEVVLATVTASEALNAAQEASRSLRPGQIYADLNSASPRVKEAIAAAIAPSGAGFADATIMGTPAEQLHRVPILASGDAAERLRALMAPCGMQITVVGERPGRAAAIKMFRSGVMKGLEALLGECLLAARRYGVDDVVLESMARFMDSKPFAEMANMLITTDAIHALRRAQEVDFAVQTIEETGVEPIVTRAVRDRLYWSAGLKLKERFQGVPPASYQEVFAAIEERLAAEEARAAPRS